MGTQRTCLLPVQSLIPYLGALPVMGAYRARVSIYRPLVTFVP